MKMLKVAALAAGVGLLASGAQAAEEKFITIGTGGQTGVYFVVGQSICKLVNRETAAHGIKCTAPSTGGSPANVNAIMAGDMDMGVAQSDVQSNAFNGLGDWDGKPFEGLRSVFSVHPEPFTVVARADAGISTFEDLKGKRVNIGNPGSGQRATMEALMERLGWTTGDFTLASELKSSEQAQALCDNKIDAFVFAVGHPNGSIQEVSSSCESHLVPVTGDVVDQLLSEFSYYSKVTIPGGMYPGSDADTETFGVRATFVSSTNTDEETIYQVVKAVFDNFDRFKGLHPAFAILDQNEMTSAGLTAPLHDGAVKYFKEKGLVQ